MKLFKRQSPDEYIQENMPTCDDFIDGFRKNPTEPFVPICPRCNNPFELSDEKYCESPFTPEYNGEYYLAVCKKLHKFWVRSYLSFPTTSTSTEIVVFSASTATT